MNFDNKFWRWFTAIATILGLVTGSLALYDYVTEDDSRTMIQDVSPELKKELENLKPGETRTITKGRPVDDTRSGSD